MIEAIKEQLTLIYDGNPWYGASIKSVIKSVRPAHVFDSPENGLHSIAELIAHMIAWKEFAELRLTGETGSVVDQEQTFNWKRFSSGKKQAWDLLTDRLDSSQHHLLALLSEQENSILDQMVPGKPYTFHYLLTGLVHHDLYHLGQIVYINKLLTKKQPPRTGFLNYDFRVFSFETLALQK